MRNGPLRALLATLRAGGVSEYSTTDAKGTTTTIKLGRAVQVDAETGKAPAKAAQPVDPESRRAYEKFLAEVNVTEAQAREVLGDLH